MENRQELPEYIAGIATAKNSTAERRKFIIRAYQKLLSDLMNKTKRKMIHNDYLNVDVHLIMHEGGKEATNRAAFNWQSAYAIVHLEKIVKSATAMNGKPIYMPAKRAETKKRTNTSIWRCCTMILWIARSGF